MLGRLRWIAESLRPFFRSYVVESETEGKPFNHEERAMAKGANAVVGVDLDYEVIGQSMLMVSASGTAVVLK